MAEGREEFDLVADLLAKPSSVKKTFSALKRIKTYSRNTTLQTRLPALASMAIKKDLLMELKCTDVLYHRLNELLIKKKRRMDFFM